MMNDFLGNEGELCDSFNFELQERDAYDAHKGEYDKKTYHMNERKKIFQKKNNDDSVDGNDPKKESSNPEGTENGDIINKIRKKHQIQKIQNRSRDE